jgi:hypothetical protein
MHACTIVRIITPGFTSCCPHKKAEPCHPAPALLATTTQRRSAGRALDRPSAACLQGVVIGGVQLDGSDGERRAVSQVLVHPGYDGSNAVYSYDMAVLVLDTASTKAPIQVAPGQPLALLRRGKGES